MKRLLNIVISLLLCLYITATAEEMQAEFEIKTEPGENTVTAAVGYKNAVGMCGGALNLVYDNKVLGVVFCEDGEQIKNNAHFINDKFSENTIRVNWAGTEVMPTEGTVIKVTFSLAEGAEFKKEYLKIDKLKIADSNGRKLLAVWKNEETDSPEASDKEEEAQKPSSSSGGGGRLKPIVKPQEEEKEEKDADKEPMLFADVNEEDWFFQSVSFVVEKGLMMGVGEDIFAPKNPVTRAMFVTVLYRYDGEKESKPHSFTDVDENSWYNKAVSWASENGIVMGVSEDEFAPDSNITREQMAAILYRYAQSKGETSDNDFAALYEKFSDKEQISPYAVDAMGWMIKEGLMSGKSETELCPEDNTVRAEMAAVFMRMINE